MKRELKRFVRTILLKRKLIIEGMYFIRLLLKYNASVNTDSDIEKMQYTLLRENHTIEKGLSMKAPRKGFGQAKVIALLGRLGDYFSRYYDDDKSFLDYPMSTVKHYIEYTTKSGVPIPDIEARFASLSGKLDGGSFREIPSGIVMENRVNVLNHCDQNFRSLLYSRHSVRYFTDEIVSKEIVDDALALAQRTPSACNRQGWLTHVYFGERSHDLLRWQGGARGFEDEIHTSVLVTCNLKAFLSYEVHQAYVDGGLYAMNLINAFHSLGLGTIPLSVAFYCDKLKKLKDFGIPENEVPIVIIGVGCLPDEFKIAVSERKDIKSTNTYH